MNKPLGPENQFTSEDVDILEQATVYQRFFRIDKFTLRHKLFEGGWSQPIERELFIRDEAVFVLLYDPNRDRVALVEQFRIGALQDAVSPWLVELVAGMVEQGESTTEVAMREAQEEAGADILDLEPICQYHVSPGGSREYMHVFCGKVDASTLSGIHGLVDEGENIKVVTLDREQAYQAVVSGRINNAATIIAIQWLQLNLALIQDKWLNGKDCSN